MRKLKVYYANVDNMGDKLNAYLMRRLFGYEIVRRTPLTCELSGIGSGLGQFTYSQKKWLSSAEVITGKLWPETFVWGTGFIDQREDAPFYRGNMKFCAVRGQLSKQRVEKLLGKQMKIPVGDGGILTERAFDRPIEKKYEVGIIAHYKEQGELVFMQLAQQFPKSLIINVRQSPEIVAEQIAQCECILSSSLHGLILADSFHIPNLHIKVSNAMLGDGFKYADYYSSYGIEDIKKDLNRESIHSLYDVYDNYHVTPQMVEQQKNAMQAAFPF